MNDRFRAIPLASTWPALGDASTTRLLPWIPVAAALAYPWSLAAFHAAITSTRSASVSAVWLAIAFALPLSGLLLAWRSDGETQTAVRRMALAALASPPLFVLTGVVSGLIHSPIRDVWTWTLLWLVAGVAASLAPVSERRESASEMSGRWRVAHGVAGSVILLFVAFHLANHATGLFGAQTHARVMAIGRTVYRSKAVEPALVALLLFQIATGLRMAWRWSNRSLDFHRVIQLGSGAYLSAFILTHLNSAFVSARWVHGIQTDWGWATGAPDGLLMDAWNIRLLPHYALGVLFVVAHLFCGLRAVLLAHHARQGAANIIFAAGLLGAAGASLLISAALCGLRF